MPKMTVVERSTGQILLENDREQLEHLPSVGDYLQIHSGANFRGRIVEGRHFFYKDGRLTEVEILV